MFVVDYDDLLCYTTTISRDITRRYIMKCIKKFKYLLLIFSLCLFFNDTNSVFASEYSNLAMNEFESYGDVVTIIKPNSIVPFSYYDPSSFYFTSSNRGTSRTMDGRYMAYEVAITESTASYIQINTFVDNRLVRTDNLSSGGKIDWIDMGYTGNHSVFFTYYAKPSGGARINMKMYSWN